MKIKRLISYFLTLTIAVCCAAPSMTLRASAESVKISLIYNMQYTAIKASKVNPGDTIHFTTDGTDPTVDSKLYTKKIGFVKTADVKIAEFDKDGNVVGKIKSYHLERLLPKPKFNVTDNFDGTVSVRVVDDQAGVTIHFTTNGKDPDESSPVIAATQSIRLKADREIKAVASAEGYHTSAVASIRPFELVTEDSYDAYIQAAFKRTNEIRKQNGLKALKLDSRLCEAAQIRAEELSVSYGHTRPDGRKWYTAYAEAGYKHWHSSENYAMLCRKGIAPVTMVDLWMISPAHRDAILGEEYDDVGFGFYQKDGNCYWIQLFGDPISNYYAQKNSTNN